jgi:hypothetical protein
MMRQLRPAIRLNAFFLKLVFFVQIFSLLSIINSAIKFLVDPKKKKNTKKKRIHVSEDQTCENDSIGCPNLDLVD